MRFLLLLFLFISSPSFGARSKAQLSGALKLMERGDFIKGSKELYRLSRRRALKRERVQIKYTLGIAFTKMQLYHMASLQFIYVIKSKNKYYRKKAIEKLVGLADFLGDEDFVYYILTKVRIQDFPAAQRNKLYFYFGLLEFKKKRYSHSRSYFSRVRRGTPFYNKALYKIALSYAEEGRPVKAARIFNQLASSRSRVTDQVRVAAKMGEARSFYQAEKFDQSLMAYRAIPRDSKHWHSVLLESSWAYLRSARFRSALSNFQTLHSSFYEGHYQPESLILRAYVYLYICKYYEMEKVLDFFNLTYMPILKSVKASLKNRRGLDLAFQISGKTKRTKLGSSISLASIVRERLEKQTAFQSVKVSLLNLKREKGRLNAMPHYWITSPVGRNANAVVDARIATMKKRTAKIARFNLLEIKGELERLAKLEQYLRYDMLRGKREFVKKKIQRKYADDIQIDEKLSRDYYIKNGYEYWPFKGENWLDELGNYHYIGLQSCG